MKEEGQQPTVKIGNKLVGAGRPHFIVAELGINHNGSLDIAKKLIDLAAAHDCDAVKFQKRTIEVVYTPEELARPRENPFGTTNEDLKRGLEFGQEEYEEINRYCKEKNILWFASCWDEGSVDFIDQFDPPAYKIASASLTDDNLLKHTRSKGKPIILSTGMSTLDEIKHAVEVLGENDLIILHCTATYPSKLEELNLNLIPVLKEMFPRNPIGYSCHSPGIVEPIMGAVLGACLIEKHITLDRTMWGSDHAASLGPDGLYRMARDIRNLPGVLGDGEKRVYESEIPIKEKLRRIK